MRVAACVALLVTAVCAEVPNGEFNKGIQGWVLVNNSGTAKLSHDKKAKALKFVKGGAGGMDVARFDLDRIPNPGTEFVLKAKFKGANIGNGWFKVFFYDKNGGDLGQGRDVKPLRGTFGLQEIALNLKVPANASRATIFILLVMPGTLWVDDVELALAPGPKLARDPLEDKRLKKWLDRNAIPMATLSLEGGMRDLAPLARQLSGVRIVQLGENTHGDGLAFAAKVRLIRWLHERMGFDVVAFESGMFECERANRLLQADGNAKSAMRRSVFAIWHTQRTLPLFEYMIAQSKTRKPMRLTGFDIRKSGGDRQELIPDVVAFLKAAGIAVTEHPTPKSLLELLQKNVDALVKAHSQREVSYFRRVLEIEIVEPEFEALKGKERTNIRDKWMAQNLRWLAETRYPKAKIICWAATAHQGRNFKEVTSGGQPMYDGVTMMGDYVHKQFGRKCYTIGFVSHGGWAGLWTMRNFKLPAPDKDSVEALLYRYDKSPLIVPLKSAPIRWPRRMAPMSYGRGIAAPWPKVLDAIIYFDEMEPAVHMGR